MLEVALNLSSSFEFMSYSLSLGNPHPFKLDATSAIKTKNFTKFRIII